MAERGLCFVRAREDGRVVLTSYGRSSGFCVDPIEKKPLNHFLPGTPVLSFGTAGCNLACRFCQNWDISKSKETDTLADRASPEDIARGPVGLTTIVGLCSEATVEELNAFGARLSRPLPGGGKTAAKWLACHLPTYRTEGQPFEVDEKLFAWARENQARRLWAVVGLIWGLDAETITASFDELLALGARPRAIETPAVDALVGAPPRELARQLRRERGLDVMAAEVAADTGVTGREMDVVLPTALSAIAGALATDAAQGVATCALLIRSRVTTGVDPDRLDAAAREGTPAAGLAHILARLWRSTQARSTDAP